MSGVARDLRWALDPVAFAKEALGFEPDCWQAEVLASQAPAMLLNCCRQSGKSTTTAILALHTALYVPASLVLLLSPSLRQSSELFRKVSEAFGALTPPVASVGESATRIELGNGSRIVSLPGSEQTTRGFSGVSLLVVDEASRVADDLYYSIRPMLAVSQGRLVAMSTPFGQRGWWYEAWAQGGGDWQRVRVPAQDCPRISAAFLASERESMPAWFYKQEYDCEFTDSASQFFGSEHIRAALDNNLAPLFGR